MFVKTRTKRGAKNSKHTSVRINPETDHQIILALAEHRLLRTSHLSALTGRSVKALNGRLRQLKNADYIGWVDPKKERFHNPNPEDLHALGDQGYELATYLTGRRKRQVSYTALNKSIGKDDVSHLLLINDLLVPLQVACSNSNGALRFIPQSQILQKVTSRLDAKDPLKLTARIGRVSRSTVPDMLFGIEITELGKTAYFFGEADRGTLRQNTGSKSEWSSNKSKYEVYYHYWKQGLHEDEFLINNFRVLFYTSKTEARARNLIDVVEPIYEGGRDQWLFSWTEELFARENILDAIWLTGKGKPTNIP